MILWACSGKGAGKLIAENIEYAEQMAWAVGVMSAVSLMIYLFMRRYKAFPIVCLALLALHPAWTIGGIMGDCGFLKAGAASFFVLFCGLALGLQSVAAGVMLLGWSARRLSSASRKDYSDDDDPQSMR
jgi:hypothetical protein